MKTLKTVSERRACKVIGINRSVKRYVRVIADDEIRLSERVVALASEFGRYGYRKILDFLRMEGWVVNHKRVERIWRQEGLKVPEKQPKRARLWLEDGSTIRLRPTHAGHVWSYDFVMERTREGRPIKMLTVVDEFTRECLAIEVRRRITSQGVIDVLSRLMLERGCPEHVRSDNGPEFIAEDLRDWFETLEVKPLFIAPGSPWENGYIESFNGKLRNELLDGEIFYTLFEAKVIIERWRILYNTIRPHMSLGGRPPAPAAIGIGFDAIKSKQLIEIRPTC